LPLFMLATSLKTGMYLRKWAVQTIDTSNLLLRVLTVQLKSIVIHAGLTGSLLELTCQAVCVK
jgi:hypothetical protein